MTQRLSASTSELCLFQFIFLCFCFAFFTTPIKVTGLFNIKLYEFYTVFHVLLEAFRFYCIDMNPDALCFIFMKHMIVFGCRIQKVSSNKFNEDLRRQSFPILQTSVGLTLVRNTGNTMLPNV